MNRLLVGVLLAATAPALAQGPAARLGAPAPPHVTARASDADDPPADRPGPAARLGPISSARVSTGRTEPRSDARDDWDAPPVPGVRATPTARTRGRDRDADWYRDDPPARRSRGRDRTVADERSGADPIWWPGRERYLQELRQEFPGFGAQDQGDRLAFQSDCAFDNFVSPISNPFLAEDPRSLTELRPIFMYQTIPGDHPLYRGGYMTFIGAQARVAFTERFSVVLHKLGWLSLNPGTGSPIAGETGFSEIWLGPKFVFWRNPDTQTIAAAGLQFQLPVGSGSVFQDTGGLALVPYISFGTRLGRTEFGTMHLINVTGYHLGTDDQRSDYLFNTLHLDLDVMDMHQFYPVLELTWFHYTTNGLERPAFRFEGRDLANIGGSAEGRDILTLAPGFRYKFSETLQTGVATEFAVVGGRDLFRFRLTLDLIWRY